MARPKKWRRVCSLPKSDSFGPLGLDKRDEKYIKMTIDEYESIRLIDLEGFKQEECAKQMDVARTTVQGIYTNARKKLAESLVDGKTLLIEGGEYRLCEETEAGRGLGNSCGPGCNRKRSRGKFRAKENIGN